uniref:BHLH domain-containing protein n=1 Tax=Coturnix japonica TaxID=93934 RepID=A0A8C2T7T3_COTJA
SALPRGSGDPRCPSSLLEKRRRVRIDESLNQLKTLILPLVCKAVSAAARPCVPSLPSLSPPRPSPLPGARCPPPPLIELPLLQAGEGGHPGDDRAVPDGGSSCSLGTR